MFLTVLLGLCLFQVYNAVEFSISARGNMENLEMDEGNFPIVLKVYQIRDDIRGRRCSGFCSINEIKLMTTCNFIDESGSRHLNILIEKSVEKKFSGTWHCNFEMEGSTSERPVEYFSVKVKVKPIDFINLPPPNIILPVFEAERVEYNITSPNAVNNLTMEEGNRTLVVHVTGIQQAFGNGVCDGWCEVDGKENITTSSCLKYEMRKSIDFILNTHKIDKSHSGFWACSMRDVQEPNQKLLFTTLSVQVIGHNDSKLNKWLYVGIALGLLLIIIVAQTICIIHFKSKAKKAEINKNLTPNKTAADDSRADARYVKQDTGTGDVRESVIYEALDTIKGAPIPPPIETMPVSNLSRSVSTNNLLPRPHEHLSQTSPRLQKTNQNVGKFNTVDRIRSRPPLPTPDEIYEIMAPGDGPTPLKSGWFKNKTQEQSPLLTKQKPQFDMSPTMPPQDQRTPVSPYMGRKPVMPGTSRMQPGMLPGTLGAGPTGRPPPGALGAMQVLPSMITAANLRPVKKSPSNEFRSPPDQRQGGGQRMQLNPARIPAQQHVQEPRNFTPDVHSDPRMPGFRMPEDRMQGLPGFRMQERLPQPRMQGIRMPGPQDGFRMQSPQDGFRMQSQDGFRLQSQDGFRMPMANDQPFMNTMPKPNPGPAPLTKPKPPIPLPTPEPEPMEPGEPEMYYGSSDEEFDCYDVLPEYRIYGNAPPKKLQKPHS